MTGAYDLPCGHVIHTVGPVWGKDNAELLSCCYYNCLDLAAQNGIRSIAFPAISTGTYGYPPEQAAKRAVRAVVHMLVCSPELFDRIVFVMYSDKARETYEDVRDRLYSRFDYLWK